MLEYFFVLKTELAGLPEFWNINVGGLGRWGKGFNINNKMDFGLCIEGGRGLGGLG